MPKEIMMENQSGQGDQRIRYNYAVARLVALTIMGFIGISGILLSTINQNIESPDYLFGYLAIVVFGLAGVSFSAFGILRANRSR